jgi:uncharacterized phiE125 gp8 family phage protein
MSLTVTTPPVNEPVSLALAKEWLRVDTGDTSQDNILAVTIAAARQAVEDYLNRALITQTLTWVMAGFDTRAPIWLPRIKASSITSITTHDGKVGAADTLVSSADYELVEGTKIIRRGSGWTAGQAEAAATVVYVAGYGTSDSDVPSIIRQAILRIIAQQYSLRGDTKTHPMIDATTAQLLADYRYLL